MQTAILTCIQVVNGANNKNKKSENIPLEDLENSPEDASKDSVDILPEELENGTWAWGSVNAGIPIEEIYVAGKVTIIS